MYDSKMEENKRGHGTIKCEYIPKRQFVKSCLPFAEIAQDRHGDLLKDKGGEDIITQYKGHILSIACGIATANEGGGSQEIIFGMVCSDHKMHFYRNA